jgi:CRISPR/Cas system-associated exonuclease Cas4 (RecB family)
MIDDNRIHDTPCMFYDEMTPEGMVSASQIRTFLSCRRRWQYAYRNGLRQRRERDYLTVGKLCHAGMEAAMRARWFRDRDGDQCDLKYLQWIGRMAIQDMWADYMRVTDFMDEEIPEQEELLDRAIDVFSEALEEFDPMRWLPVTVVRDG